MGDSGERPIQPTAIFSAGASDKPVKAGNNCGRVVGLPHDVGTKQSRRNAKIIPNSDLIRGRRIRYAVIWAIRDGYLSDPGAVDQNSPIFAWSVGIQLPPSPEETRKSLSALVDIAFALDEITQWFSEIFVFSSLLKRICPGTLEERRGSA